MSHAQILVVAGALERSDGLVLMQRRPLEKHHGGLWEFPGGKVEPTEIAVNALVRELFEETGITLDPAHCSPACFAEDALGTAGPPIVILLYKVLQWQGEPRALEGGEIDWFTPSQIAQLPRPPLDQHLAASLFAKA